MKETRMPLVYAANLVADSGNTINGVLSYYRALHLLTKTCQTNTLSIPFKQHFILTLSTFIITCALYINPSVYGMF